MASRIKTVGVISTGVIGSSFTALYLARGLRVLVCSTSAGAEQRLEQYLEHIWPTLDAQIGLSPGASPTNWEFVGETLDGHYDRLDFIQEVCVGVVASLSIIHHYLALAFLDKYLSNSTAAQNAPERPDLKTKIFAEADAAARPEVVIASSTSGLPSSRFVGSCAKHPERVLVCHPSNPPHLIPLIEVVPHPGTSSAACDVAMDFYRSLGRRPTLIREEIPGFVTNRLQAALGSEAYSLVARGIVSAEEIGTLSPDPFSAGCWRKKTLADCSLRHLCDRKPRAVLGHLGAVHEFMTNVLGGGGGHDGFLRLMQRVGLGAKAWTDDMRANAVELNEESMKTLDESVQKMLDKFDQGAFVRERNEVMVALMKLKEKAAGLHPKTMQDA